MKSLYKRTYLILVSQLTILICCNMNAHATGQETVYLQTDRTVYVTGESIYYKMYVLDNSTRKCSDVSKIGYIELRTPKSNPSIKIRVKVNAGMARGCIVLPDTLSSGAYQVVAFTALMKNSGEQYFFQNEIVIANRFDKSLDFNLIKSSSKDSNEWHPTNSSTFIKTDKQVYGPREKVVVHLGKTNANANVAVSVFEEPAIKTEDKSIDKTLDELAPASSRGTASTEYLPESKAKILRGRVIDSTTQKGVQSAIVLLSCPDTVANLQYARTNSDGMFLMSLGDYYNGKELFFTIKDVPQGQTWKIKIEDNFNLSETWDPNMDSDKCHVKEYLSKSQDIFYINKSYKLDDGKIEKPISEDSPICPQLYRSHVNPVYPADFEPLNDFPEISVEILPKVRVSKHDDKYHAHIVNSEVNIFGNYEPTIFLDGVYVDDINKIIDLGSERIKKIEVVESKRAFGDLVFYGIISITSKSNEIVKTVPASNSLRLKNDKISNGKNFVTINPASIENKSTPFFKQLLYWNPDMKLKKDDSTDFEFYTSDNTANFIIKVDGISEDGTPISGSSSIQVNDSK